jgi:Mlc titration factor MtfA (ptsG expression regulator)
MITALQVIFVLTLIVIIVMFVFQPKRREGYVLPDHYRDLLLDYVSFYARLDEEGQQYFEKRLEKFLGAVKIVGANADVEDLDRALIAAAAIIPVYHIRDWEYIHLREVLVYPGNFNFDYEQQGYERSISGMVGTGALQNVMILSKWELRQGFVDGNSSRNTAIHEFVHLIDKLDGTLDGVPELLLERKYVSRWKELLEETMEAIRNGTSDIDPYGATSPVECFAVMAEYYFEKNDAFATAHPELTEMLQRIFMRGASSTQAS